MITEDDATTENTQTDTVDEAASSGFNWSSVSTIVSEAVSVLAPVAEAAVPEAAAAIAIATKIVQGLVAEEPAAVALYKQITGGTPATPAQLQAYATQYEAAYQQLNTDINKQLAALPAE